MPREDGSHTPEEAVAALLAGQVAYQPAGIPLRSYLKQAQEDGVDYAELARSIHDARLHGGTPVPQGAPFGPDAPSRR